jgi:3-oxoacyl-[acyl-carrier-protein] synthase-1
MSKILISGMGIVSAIGNNVAETLLSLQQQRSGIDTVKYLKTAHTEFPVGEVKMSNEEMMRLLQISENQIVTRTSLMGILAVKEAIESACGLSPDFAGQRVALISGTTVGGMDKSEQFYQDFLENDSKNEYIKSHDCGACTEMIADYFGIFTQLQTISTACSSAANAIILGAELLKSGRADIVVVGGSECITKFHLNGFNTLMILDREKCRPFDATRAGLNLGEGAAYLVMETEDHFKQRVGMQVSSNEYQVASNEEQISSNEYQFPLAVLSGYANTCDAYHQTASSPEGEGAFLAMKQALEMANLQVADIDYINAHGTATANNDLSEGIAIQRLFGDCFPPVSSTKAFTGHSTSAAGGVEAVISILALKNNFIPVNLGFKQQMEELQFSPYCNEYQNDNHLRLANILSNSFGFGGNDTSLIFSNL